MQALLLASATTRLKGRALALLNRQLIKGTPEHGYYGEFAAADVATSGELVAAINGLSVSITNTNPEWLGFSLNGKSMLVTKRPIGQVTWNELNARGLVTGKEITIKGNRYMIRLMRGAGIDPLPSVPDQLDHPYSHGSEWNRLMYHVAATGTMTSEDLTTGDWAQLTNAELGITTAWEDGTWCLEIAGGIAVQRSVLGDIGRFYGNYPHNNAMWRPVLEPI